MILSKNNKQRSNQKPETSRPRRIDLGFLGVGGRGGRGMDGHYGDLGCKLTFGMDGQWDPTVQQREMCVTGSLCCTTELDETL